MPSRARRWSPPALSSEKGQLPRTRLRRPSSNSVEHLVRERIERKAMSTENNEVDLSKPPAEGMVRVTFMPEGKTVEFEYGTMPYDHHGKPMSFLDVAENYGIFLDHACGGVCACTTCHICGEGKREGHQRGRGRRTGSHGYGRGSAIEFAPGMPGRYHRTGLHTSWRFPSWNRNYVSEGKPLTLSQGK